MQSSPNKYSAASTKYSSFVEGDRIYFKQLHVQNIIANIYPEVIFLIYCLDSRSLNFGGS